MDLNRVRTFLAVVVEGTVHGAAGNLGYTPSAVSQQLHALQREVGLELLERHGRGLRLTAVGRRFAAEAEALLDQASRLNSLAADLRQGRTGSLTIMHLNSVGGAWIPQIAARMAEEFPALRLDFRLWEHSQGRGEDPDVEINLAGAWPQSAAATETYETRELLTEPYVVVLPAGHRLAGRPEVELEDLRQESWIDNTGTQGSCSRIVHDACAARGFSPPYRMETQGDGTAVAFVETGAGITLMPQLSFATARADLSKVAVARVVNPTPTRTLLVRTKRTLLNNPAVQRILQLLQEQTAVTTEHAEAVQEQQAALDYQGAHDEQKTMAIS
ncbi:LysR family transcriptional regulator [Nesterenkonia rhizosphaerae]